MTVSFEIDNEVFTETPMKEITEVTLTVRYANPQGHGYPTMCNWSRIFDFNVEEIRRKIHE